MNEQKKPFTIYLLIGVVLALAFSGYQALTAKTPPQTRQASESNRTTSQSHHSNQPLSDTLLTQRKRNEKRLTISTEDYVAEFTNLNASLRHFRLRNSRYLNDHGQAIDLVSTEREEWLPLHMQIRGVEIPTTAQFAGEQISPTEVRFTWENDLFRVVRKIEAGQGRYQLVSTVRIENLSNQAHPVRLIDTLHHYVRRSVEGGGFLSRPSTEVSHGLCVNTDDEIREDREELLDARGLDSPNLIGIERTFFGVAIASDGQTASRCVVGATDRYQHSGGKADGSLFEAQLHHERKTVGPQQSVLYRSVIYAGPKEPLLLAAAGHHFGELLDLGTFGFIASGMNKLLGTIRTYVSNWGLAIVLLTFLVKLILYPLTERSFQSMARMRILKPELDAINEKLKDQTEARGQAIMALYQKHKINPLAGCLPSVAQMPVWFALYQSLSSNVALYHAPFFGYVHDLSAPDRFFIMPLALGALMYVQQKITPQTMDPQQAKIMLYMMPTMITAFMLFLPAGLCVYMLTNSTLGIAQQKFIQWRLDRATAKHGTSEVEQGVTDTKTETSSIKPHSKGKKGGST